MKDVKSKKSMKYLETSSLRVGTTHLLWRDQETAALLKRSIVRARILTGTYTLQANRHTFSKKTVDSTCNHCQHEAEYLHHMVCRCQVFYEYRKIARHGGRNVNTQCGTVTSQVASLGVSRLYPAYMSRLKEPYKRH